jgi:DNA modification methylase
MASHQHRGVLSVSAAVQWPADHTERRPISSLIPFARNANVHAESQIAQVAASLREWGWTMPILIDEAGTIIAGHCRVLAAQRLGLIEAPVVIARGWSDAQKRAYVIADNRLAQSSTWNIDMLSVELDELRDLEFNLDLLGFEQHELNDLIGTPNVGPDGGLCEADDVPDVSSVAITALGDVWRLGEHRLMCGDSTDPASVAHLMNGKRAQLLHADPPYGLGFDDQGVLNDDLAGSELTEFQLRWWRACRPSLEPNASAYIWGTEEPLMLLWVSLKSIEPLTFKNELVWDKKHAPMMKADTLTRYSPATERCLFFGIGRYTFSVNQTQDDYWQGWEPIRSWLCAERDRAGFTPEDVRRICSNYMYGHWFSRSQWSFITRENYAKLAAAAAGKAFTRSYNDLLAEFSRIDMVYQRDIREPRVAEFQAARSYFDNGHAVMRDVWEFPRVVGEERHDHPTPKPVEMIERVLLSSTREGELVIEPFIGTGSTLLAAHRTARRCFGMELEPRWVDVTVRRWQAFTGESAVLERTGQTFEQTAAERSPHQETSDGVNGRLDSTAGTTVT